MNQFRYILRYYIDPDFHEDDRITELTGFCREAGVDEVMLFFNAEELNTGHFTMAELRRWLDLARKVKLQLQKHHIDLSVNPWTTTGHCDRGRRLKPGQNYQLMTDAEGSDNGLTACPLDDSWLEDLCELWKCTAAELRPVTVWMEDDFRFHNHSNMMRGCYCSAHLDLFNQRAGTHLSRQELAEGLWGPDFNPEWRRIFLDMLNETSCRAARKIAAAVTEGSPETSMGLMSGYFDSFASDGRNWQELQDALSPDGKVLSFRPTMSPYTEVWPLRRPPVNARMTVSQLARPLNIYPELESAPRHGAYSLGTACAAWQILESACFGARGITMNLFDMLGNGTVMDRQMAAVIGAIHPRLEAMASLQIDDRNFQGARILISPKIGYTAPGDGHSLQTASDEWGNVTAILGIAAGFVSEITPSEDPYLVNSHTLTAFSDQEIQTLLSQRVILDAAAVKTLVQRGFGPDIGLSGTEDRTSHDCPYSYEEIPEEDPRIYGLSFPRLSAQRAVHVITELSPLPQARILSSIKDCCHRCLFPGAVEFHTPQGGTAVSLCYTLGNGEGNNSYFYFGFFSPLRRIFMQRLLRQTAPDNRGACIEDEPFRPYVTQLADGSLFAAGINATTDVRNSLRFRFSNRKITRALRLLHDGNWSEDQIRITPDGKDSIVTVLAPIPVYEMEALRLS